jgi:ATP-dependent protease Clp ATPase subunit
MFEIPSRTDVKKIVINGEVISNHLQPVLLTRSSEQHPSELLVDESA